MITKEMKDNLKNCVCSNGFKNELVNRLNTNINVPFISEKTEGKILMALVEEVEELIVEQIDSL